MRTRLLISPLYRRALYESTLLQGLLLLLSGFLLDGGALGRLCAYALVPFWSGVVLVVCCRPRHPTPGDLSFVRLGYLPVAVATGWLTFLVWRLRGIA